MSNRDFGNRQFSLCVFSACKKFVLLRQLGKSILHKDSSINRYRLVTLGIEKHLVLCSVRLQPIGGNITMMGSLHLISSSEKQLKSTTAAAHVNFIEFYLIFYSFQVNKCTRGIGCEKFSRLTES